jgi:hypothetical protein
MVFATCGIKFVFVNLSWYTVNRFLLEWIKGIWLYADSVPVRFMLKEIIFPGTCPFFPFVTPNIIH